MSGTLTTLTGLTSGVPVLGGLASIVSGLLSAASWRGVPFYLLSGGDSAGNRVVKFQYPGQARADFQFLGGFDGPMPVEGLLIGADCVAQWAKMRAASQVAGHGKLRHPWWGQFDAVLTGEGIRFDVTEQEFGLVRFHASFERYLPVRPPKPDFFGRLQDQVNSLLGSATDFLSDVMGQLAGPLALYSFATGLLATAASVYSSLGLGSGGSAIAAAVAPAVLALGTATPALGSDFAATVSGLLGAPALAIANASQPTQAPAVGAGPLVSVAAATIDPADAAAALLTASAGLAATANASPSSQAIALSAQMQAAAQAAAVGATISFASTEDAATWGGQIDAALAGLQSQAAALAILMPLSAGPAWHAIAALRQSAAACNNALALTLPSLQTVTTTRTMDAWKIALALFGDTPATMEDAVIDLWNRNYAARNPAAVPAGTYSVLPPT